MKTVIAKHSSLKRIPEDNSALRKTHQTKIQFYLYKNLVIYFQLWWKIEKAETQENID